MSNNNQTDKEAIELMFITLLLGLVLWFFDSLADVVKHTFNYPHLHNARYFAEAWTHKLFMQWLLLSFIVVIVWAVLIKLLNLKK